MIRIATWIRLWAVAALALASPASFSYGLGELDLRSHLNEPLQAVIELIGTTEKDELSATLLQPDYYESRNLMYVPVLQEVDVAVRREGGQAWLVVTTTAPVNEFFLDLAISVTSGRLTQIRHYTLLVDVKSQAAAASPSTADAAASPTPPKEPSERITARTRTAPVAIERTGTGIERTGTGIEASSSNYGPVRSGESLWKISERLSGTRGGRLYALMDELVALNPSAFVNGDPNRLRVGATLALPPSIAHGVAEPAMTETVLPTEALARLEATWQPERAEPQAQQTTSSSQAPAVVSKDQLEIAAAPEQKLTEVLDEWIQTDEASRTPQEIEGIERDLSLAAAEQETLSQENQRLQTQIAALEERVSDLQRLMTLQEEVMERRAAGLEAEAQTGAIAATPVVNAPEPDVRSSFAFWVAALFGLLAAATLGYLAFRTFTRRSDQDYGPTLDIEFGANTRQAPQPKVAEVIPDTPAPDKEDWSEVLEAAAIAADESFDEEPAAEDYVLSESVELRSEPDSPTFDIEMSTKESAEADEIESLLDNAKKLITDGQVDEAEDVLEKVLRQGSQAQRAEATYLFLEMS